ncbi:hypothetical protein GWK47_016095 [Chionoecetes opilio]|uniref:Uncharacterized protein n=1 Tax=Chionoecetes opilio TaxID=41210 RepID=A0A8J4XWS7_CHIOP|nr:hypothetical protein GWK47_016095 [Chionoecetes opilio]
MHSLTEWERLLMVLMALAVVVMAGVVVTCVVRPGCWLNTLLLDEEERRRREKERMSLVMPSSAPTLRLPPVSQQTTPRHANLKELNLQTSHTPVQTKQSHISPQHSTQEAHTLLGSLQSKRDSTYSSMSEYSGRTSPTNSCRVRLFMLRGESAVTI